MYFWATDFLRFLLAFCLYALFLIPPGAMLARCFRVDWAEGAERENISVALALSASCLPALMFLAGHFFSNPGVWCLLGLFWLTFAYHYRRLRLQVSPRVIAGAFLVAILFYVTLADLPGGEKLFGSITNIDYVKHTAVTAAVARDGVHPLNPFLRPGHDIGLFYYFYWHMVAGWVMKCGPGVLNSMSTFMASAVWAFLVFLAVLHLYLRQISTSEEQLRSRRRLATVLLLVTGLDLAGMFLAILENRAAGVQQGYAHLEFWNIPEVASWLATFVWVPQHVIGLSAGVTGLLAARHAAERRHPDRIALGYSLLAGLCFASAAGASVWVALSIGTGAACWIGWSVIRRDWREARAFGLAGVLAVVLSLPYLLYLDRVDAVHSRPVNLTVRGFSLVHPVTKDMPATAAAAVRLAALPINYGLEFGFYALAAGIYLVEVRRRQRVLGPIEKMGLAVTAASILVVTFFESEGNNLGMRGCLPAQFFLLLTAVLVVERQGSIEPARRMWPRVLALCAVFGAAGSLYDWAGTRFSSVVQYAAGAAAGEDEPHMRYDIRRAYEFVHAHTAPNAVVEQNPGQHWAVLYGLDGDRPVAVSDEFHGALFSVPKQEYERTMREIKPLFENGMTSDAVGDVVRRYSLAAVIVRRTDPVWDDAAGWTGERSPDFATPLVRVYLFPESR